MFAVRRNGGCDAKDFIQGLDKQFRARYQRYLQRLRDGIGIQAPQKIRRLSQSGTEPLVYELKVDKYRLYVVKFGGRWFATHGREKPKNNQVKNEIEKSIAIFWEGNEG